MDKANVSNALVSNALTLAGMIAVLASGPADGAEFPLTAGATAVGAMQSYVTRDADTLAAVARHYDLGYTQLVAPNRHVDPWLPGVKKIVVPSFYLLPDAPREGIVINLAEERLYYYPPGGQSVITFPVGIATIGQTTPLGATHIVSKQAHPTWVPPPSILAERPDLPKSVPPGPDNPLGEFALFLGWPNYLIHGTNKPNSVGRLVSHGCMHLYPEDIAALYHMVPIGTPVTVLDEPIKVQWVGDTLYVEVHLSIKQVATLDDGDKPKSDLPVELSTRVQAAAGDLSISVDWPSVRRAGLARDGVPVAVLTRQPPPAASPPTSSPPASSPPTPSPLASSPPTSSPPTPPAPQTSPPEVAAAPGTH
jgi:L,D-transpeptidase ErfK/SrfK